MKIIEAMKTLRLIEKKMEGNMQDIERYASMVSTERPYFKDEKEQKEEVERRVQANNDLLKNYLDLKQKIELTNLRVMVAIHGVHYSISALLTLQRKQAQNMEKTFRAMNDSQGQSRLRNSTVSQDGKAPYVARFYDERKKNEGLRFWQDLSHEISARLEIVNATTDLVDE